MELSKICVLVAGIMIGWLLRWKRDKYYFDALRVEMEKVKAILKELGIKIYND